MLRQDSIATEHLTTVIGNDSVVQIPAKPQTPYQVLRLLPKDATPAQQDSAIQAWFQPGEVHYSDRPDTLHLPGHEIPHDLTEVDLPLYYRESFFSNDSLYHPELEGGRYGVAGDPLPYVLASDHIITCLLLICFVVTALAFSFCRQFIYHQLKDFFYIPKLDAMQKPTSVEVQALIFFGIQTTLVFSLLYFFYVKTYVADTFILSDEYLIIALIFLLILAYFILKYIIYSSVNLTFFNSKKNGQWNLTYLFLTAMEGLTLFPSVLLLTYFDTRPQIIAYYCIFILILVKILAFYKCYIIFFRQNALFLQIILYFCALEIIPMMALWGGLEVMVNVLKINF